MQNDQKYRVCNSVNCFYSNEYLGHEDNDLSDSPYECRFCAYDFNNLCQRRRFLKCELMQKQKNMKNFMSQNTYAAIIKTAAFAAGVMILLWLLNYFKQISS